MVFTKINQTSYRDALIKEAQGLELIKKIISSQPDNPLRIPEVISVSENELILTSIHGQRGTPEQHRQLGRGLALLHREKMPYYGLQEDNYIGLNPQMNTSSSNWGEFFVLQRLGYQISLIQDDNTRQRYGDRLEQNSDHLTHFLNLHCQQPSLLHGDLWNGNVLFDKQYAWLIDPAVYYGDREADLAMTEMFGGFSNTFYDSYDALYPRSEAYPIKRTIYNLYHYLNHYNLFGNSYLGGCEQGWQAIENL